MPPCSVCFSPPFVLYHPLYQVFSFVLFLLFASRGTGKLEKGGEKEEDAEGVGNGREK